MNAPAPHFWRQPACGIAIQPIVDLGASLRIRCGELLVRPGSPGQTVPGVLGELERSGQMAGFTLQLLDWASTSTRRLSVNVPPGMLCDEGFVDDVVAMAGSSMNLPFVEVIEDPVPNEFRLAEHLSLLRSKGFRIAFDDYADTEAHRRRLDLVPWSRVKIDRSLLHGERTALARATRRCSTVTSDIVVEGIETDHDIAVVESLGSVTLGQGFLIGPPEHVIDLSMHSRRSESPHHGAEVHINDSLVPI